MPLQKQKANYDRPRTVQDGRDGFGEREGKLSTEYHTEIVCQSCGRRIPCVSLVSPEIARALKQATLKDAGWRFDRNDRAMCPGCAKLFAKEEVKQ